MPTSPDPILILSDDAARQEFTGNLRENFCVCAGAGVGKTRAIVERIASLAQRRNEEPDLLSRLVVVTYGKLAAEELRVRTRDLLLSRTERSAYGRQRLLSDLRSAFFGTIHSYCLKLIGEHSRFLALPEKPVLLEDRDEPALWAKFCDSEALAGLVLPPETLEQVSRHLTFEQLLNLARQLDPGEIDEEEMRSAESGMRNEENAEADSGHSALRIPHSALPPDFSDALADDGGKNPRARTTTLRHQENLRRWLADFADAANRPFLALPEFSGGSGKFLAAVDDALRPYALWLNRAAAGLAAAIARAWRDYRLDRGVLTYRDMIFWCRQLIDRPAVLRRLRERRLILILDEAQDTDAEMFAILSEITRPLDAEPGGWPDDAAAPGPEPGRFSFVGDEQQAIYRERADPAVYRRYVDAFRDERGGRRLEFSVTMRCPSRVITAVNALFADARLPQPDCEFRGLDERPDCPPGAVWRLDLGDAPAPATDGGRVNTAARVMAECEAVAAFLQTRGLAGLGVRRWDEVALLAPRIDWLEAAARALAARGLPANLLSQKRAARELPVHSWPAALLHVLVNPWDRFELIGVLRELFAVSDVELARWHRAAPAGLAFWPEPDRERVTAAKTPGAKRLRDALALLRELRAALPSEPENAKAQRTETLGRYVAFVLERSALAERLRAVGEDPEGLERLRVASLQAECDGLALRPWVQRLVESLELPPPAAPDAPEAVQLLTCQKAKGLEWPVVIPLGLACQIRERSRSYPRLERGDGRFTVHFSDRTLDPSYLGTLERKRREELQRLLYVTLTRARNLLIFPDGTRLHAAGEPNFLALARWAELPPAEAERLFPPVPEAETLLVAGCRLLESESGRSNEAVLPTTSNPQPATRSNPQPATRRQLARAAKISARIPQRILPSSLVHDRMGEARVLAADAAALGEDDGGGGSDGALLLGGVGGVDYGDWWHRTVERYPWQGDAAARTEHLQTAVARLATADPAGAARAEIELARFTASAAHGEFLAAGRVFLPEAPFSYPRSADEWLEGIMDLVLVTAADELWVVDWKTDRPRQGETAGAQLARLAEKYGPQLRAYAEVFERGFGRPVTRLLLYSTPLGRTAAVAPATATTPARRRSPRTPRPIRT